DMDEAVAERLEEITVDVDTVEVTELADELAAAKTRPLPSTKGERVAAGRFDYSSSLSVQGNEMEMEVERRIAHSEEEGRKLLEITSTTSSAMGSGSDRFVLDADSLRPVRREAEQGPATISVEFGRDAVTGEINANGQQMPIEIDLDAPAFGGEAALEVAILGLPLSEDYSHPLRFAEVGMQQRVRYFRLDVDGRETVNVPAGEFEAWRIDLSALDDEGGDLTLWVSADAPRKVLRAEGKLPAAMGGGEYTTVLTATGE
ncbi:MAG: DUF3108 domain-containing protein, partial [Wenzhouxiangella sp.]